MFSNLGKYRETGILILRLGIGIMFMLHGWGKITGGPDKWLSLGKHMSDLGITFGYTFWGFMSSLSEFGGGLLFALGLFFRPVCIIMFINMCVAYSAHWLDPDNATLNLKAKLLDGSEAIETGILFLSMIFIGPGKYSIDKK